LRFAFFRRKKIVTDFHNGVRDVTDDEVQFFFDNGWVHLPSLLSPELTSTMLDRAKQWMGVDGNSTGLREGKDIDSGWFKDYHDPSRDDELFESVALSETLGRNAARLLGRDTTMRFLTDLLAVKLPSSEGSGRGEITDFHQDAGLLPFDRTSVNVWIALDTVTADQGPLQFYSRSHKLGQLGSPCDWENEWPRVANECEKGSSNGLAPGDATIHSSFTLHGADANMSDRPRWGYISSYFAADSRFAGKPYRHTAGLDLKPLRPFVHPKFPDVYVPGETGRTVRHTWDMEKGQVKEAEPA
jgi:hypothetical protein